MLSINGLERPIAIYLYGRKMYEMLATPAAAASAGSGVRDCGAPAAESAGDDEVRSAGAGRRNNHAGGTEVRCHVSFDRTKAVHLHIQ